MIRAVIFDYYSVFKEDKFQDFIAMAEEISDDLKSRVEKEINNYYLGITEFETFKRNLEIDFGTHDLPTQDLILNADAVPPQFDDITQKLHLHFLKVAIAGNIGKQEVGRLKFFNEKIKQFDFIIGPLNYGDLLTSNKFFEGLLNEIGEPPQNCLLVSGHNAYLSSAKKVGINTYPYQDFNVFKLDLFRLLEID